MTQELNPVTQQRRLRAMLRQARTDANFSQKQVAEALDWSLSKVIRVEHGAVKVSVTDLRALLMLYGITEPGKVDELIAIARLGKQQHWWDKYRNILEASFTQYLELESVAIRNRQFQATTMPGLLQTKDYARKVISLHNFQDSEETIEQYVNVRMQRKEVLDASRGQEFFFILDEAVLRRQIGTAEMMRGQLTHLKEVNKQPNVSIQVVPFTAGSHRAMLGSFTIVEVPTGIGGEVDYTVSLQGSLSDTLIKNDPERASEYVEMFIDLESMAAPASNLDEMINGLTSST
ncbi:helix-turn-helix domain-containing protein [Actinokineospora sp. 24-640]